MPPSRALVLAIFSPVVVAAAFAACGDDDRASPAPTLGAPDGGTNDAGALDAEPLTEKSSCVAYIASFCQKTVACTPSVALDSCMGLTDLCPEYFFSTGSTRTIESMLQCADEFTKMPCEAFKAGIRPACQTPGTLAAGAPCLSPAQCESSSCNGLSPGTRCGTCARLYRADEPCTGSGGYGEVVCPPNQRCDATTARCAPIRVATLPAGAPCTAANAAECAAGTTCLTTTTDAGGSGTCAAFPNVASPCARPLGSLAAAACAEGAYCTYADLAAATGTCTASAKLNEPCGDTSGTRTVVACESGLYCKSTTCAVYEALGAPCSSTAACGPNAYCHRIAAGQGVCRAPVGVGELCGALPFDGGVNDIPCASKQCRAAPDAGPSTCRVAPPLGRGADCSAPTTTCHSSLTCVGGSCTAIDYATCLARSDGG